MEEVGIDISNHRAQPVTEEMLAAADLILTMTRAHRDYLTRIYGEDNRIHSLYEFLGQDGDVLDPYGEIRYISCLQGRTPAIDGNAGGKAGK